MAKSEFRVVGQADTSRAQTPQTTVALKLGDIFPLLAHAQRNGHPWLADFADDPIAVTPDLAELLARFRDIIGEKSA